MTEYSANFWRDEVVRRLDRGAAVADVQRELVEPALGVSEDERDALWLLAWAYRPPPSRASRPRLRASVG